MKIGHNRRAADFERFRASIEGKEIGVSVLSLGWDSDGVLSQLAVDGCPLEPDQSTVVGWPSDHFEVLRAGKPRIRFDRSPK
jgi:hypothetical protein